MGVAIKSGTKSGILIKVFIGISALQLLLASVVFLSTFNPKQVVTHAVLGMGLGLYLFWIILFGSVSAGFRNQIRRISDTIRIDWHLKFVVFSIALAMLEEAVTTTMTNLAPSFGARIGQAYITASANYCDVILGHSVIAFVPMFISWSVLLSRYDFTPNQVLLLFGLTGTIGESLFGGIQHMLEIGMWMFVYGLMIYLPAYCLPMRQEAKPPRWYHFIIAVFLPFAFAVAFLAVAAPLVHHVRPSSNTTFPPLSSK
jgi:hypothetical protein